MELPEIFKILADETRLRVLNLLSGQELCVCQIIEAINTSQPNISKHLRMLRHMGLITCRKVSKWCFYSTNVNFINQNVPLYDYLLFRWSKEKPYSEDIRILNNLLKNNDCCKKLLQNEKNKINIREHN